MIIMYQISSNIKYTNNWVFLFVVSAMTQRWTKSRRLHDAAATCGLRMKRRWAENCNTNCRTIHTHHTQSFHIYSSVVVRPSECLSLSAPTVNARPKLKYFPPEIYISFSSDETGRNISSQDFPFLIVVRPPSARTDTMLLFVYIEWFCRSVVGVEISLKRRRCNYGPCSCVRLPISALSSKFFTKTNHWLTRFGWMLNKNKWCCVPPRKSDRKLNPIFHYSLARTHLLIILYAHDDGVSHTFANDDKTNNRFCSLNTV